jgi:hypothetical protein
MGLLAFSPSGDLAAAVDIDGATGDVGVGDEGHDLDGDVSGRAEEAGWRLGERQGLLNFDLGKRSRRTSCRPSFFDFRGPEIRLVRLDYERVRRCRQLPRLAMSRKSWEVGTLDRFLTASSRQCS